MQIKQIEMKIQSAKDQAEIRALYVQLAKAYSWELQGVRS